MTTRSNVLPLRPYLQATSWRAKLVVVVLYWGLCFFLPSLQPSEAIDLVFILAIAYWALVHHRKHWVPHYVRYHLLQALMMILLLGVCLGIIGAFINTVFSILPILGLGQLLNGTLYSINLWLKAITSLLLFVIPFVLGFAALLGKNPSLPSISEQARRWA
jgi:hypothetical protein